MNGEVIKSFLVSLGFGVDDASLAKFNKSIASATLRVTALYASIKIAAAGVTAGILNISRDFEQIGYTYRLIAPALNKAILLRRELYKAYGAAGIDLQKTAVAAYKLNLSFDKTRIVLNAIYKSVGAKFFGFLTKQSDIFREKIYANLPRIQKVLESLVKFIFKALDATNILGERLWRILGVVYDFFVKLDDITGGWSTKILAAIAIWKLLNLSFLATPLGQIIALGLALLTLWDDFKTFREGGQSLINWGSDFTKMVVGMTAAIIALSAAIIAGATAWQIYSNAGKIAAAVQAAVNAVMLANPIGLIVLGVTSLIGLLTLLDSKWNLFGGHVTGFFTSLGGKILDFAAGGVSGPGTTPLGVGNTSNQHQNNVNVKSQTNIYTQPGADANAIGKAASGSQNQVFDKVRNMGNLTGTYQ